jgi:hypothetical protein
MRRTGRLNGLDDLAVAATLGRDWAPHGSGSKHAETCRRRLLRPPFYGNAPRSGGGMLSALRLQPLLRALRLHLRSAGHVWLSALRATWGLFAGSRLLGRRSTKGKYHHSVSPAEGQNAPAIMTRRSRRHAANTPLRPRAAGRNARKSEVAMWPRVALFFFVAAAQLVAAAPAPAASWYPYYGGWRECWVTMSGLGVCAPRPYGRPQAHYARPR